MMDAKKAAWRPDHRKSCRTKLYEHPVLIIPWSPGKLSFSANCAARFIKAGYLVGIRLWQRKAGTERCQTSLVSFVRLTFSLEEQPAFRILAVTKLWMGWQRTRCEEKIDQSVGIKSTQKYAADSQGP